MIEYKGWKVFDIDYGGEHEFVVAKNMQDAINWHLDNVGDEYDEYGLQVSYLEQDFIVDRLETEEPDAPISVCLKECIDEYNDETIESKAFGLASSIC